jgi:hypothetical protein
MTTEAGDSQSGQPGHTFRVNDTPVRLSTHELKLFHWLALQFRRNMMEPPTADNLKPELDTDLLTYLQDVSSRLDQLNFIAALRDLRQWVFGGVAAVPHSDAAQAKVLKMLREGPHALIEPEPPRAFLRCRICGMQHRGAPDAASAVGPSTRPHEPSPTPDTLRNCRWCNATKHDKQVCVPCAHDYVRATEENEGGGEAMIA